jgi:hypothetical protein
MPVPLPFVSPASEPGTNRIERDIPDDFEHVCVGLDQGGPEPALKEVPAPVVAPVEPLRIQAVDSFHPSREVGPNGQDNQVVVIGHKAVRKASPIELGKSVAQDAQK